MLSSLNTVGGHIFVCLIIMLMGCGMAYFGRHDPIVLSLGTGLVSTGAGVAFRSMGTPETPIQTDTTTVNKFFK
jgi:hypothetical protein